MEEMPPPAAVLRKHRTPSPHLHLFGAVDHAAHQAESARAAPAAGLLPESRRSSQASSRYYSGGGGGETEPASRTADGVLPVSKTDLDLPLVSVNSASLDRGAATRHVTMKETNAQNNNQPHDNGGDKLKTVATAVTDQPASCLSCHNTVHHMDGRSLSSVNEKLSPRLSREDEGASFSAAVRSAPLTSPADGEMALMSLPRSKSLNSSFASCQIGGEDEESGRFLHLFSRETLLHLGRENAGLSGPLARLSLSGDKSVFQPGNMVLAPRAMIWTEKEAYRKHVAQIGTSACGATALVNAALALNLELSLNDVAKAVKTRLRREQSDLPDYLFSRAEAGCTHDDLLQGMFHIGRNQVVGRFFPMHRRQVALHSWLATWISRGCVPVATLNPQRSELRMPSPPQQHASPSGGGGQLLPQPPLLADAWHHQMIFGVTGREVYLTNPLEILSEDVLWPQLDSPSELLIRREDVIARFSKSTDLTQLVRSGRGLVDQRWRDYNVLGQVANVLREERSRNLSECENVCLTPYVRIPASYRSGITLFCDARDAELVSLLTTAPEFPFQDA